MPLRGVCGRGGWAAAPARPAAPLRPRHGRARRDAGVVRRDELDVDVRGRFRQLHHHHHSRALLTADTPPPESTALAASAAARSFILSRAHLVEKHRRLDAEAAER